MRYWEEPVELNGRREKAEKEITKENILNILRYIERGHLPDWNYEVHQEPKTSLPNEYYPLHVAMQVAMSAIEAQDDKFFEDLDAEYNKRQGIL